MGPGNLVNQGHDVITTHNRYKRVHFINRNGKVMMLDDSISFLSGGGGLSMCIDYHVVSMPMFELNVSRYVT